MQIPSVLCRCDTHRYNWKSSLLSRAAPCDVVTTSLQRLATSMSETPTVHLNPPFAVVTDTDHSGWVIICTTLGLPILLIFSFIRYIVRRAVDFGLDDGLIAASTVGLCRGLSCWSYADWNIGRGDYSSVPYLGCLLTWLWPICRRDRGWKSCQLAAGMRP